MTPFKYRVPSTVDEAVSALAAGGDEARPLAGGMTLIPSMKHHLLLPSLLVDLRRIPSLRGISLENGRVVIGAMTTHHEVENSALVAQHLPALARLAGGIGDAQVRHRGTIGGAVANNDPSADYPAACLALDATIVTNRRELRAGEFFKGFFATALAPGELITSIRFVAPKRAAYVKFASQASRYATVGVFVSDSKDGPRVAVTGAGQEGVFRVRAHEAALAQSFTPEKLPSHGLPEHEFISDLHASAAYRSHLVNVIAKRAVASCLGIETRHPHRHGGAVTL